MKFPRSFVPGVAGFHGWSSQFVTNPKSSELKYTGLGCVGWIDRVLEFGEQSRSCYSKLVDVKLEFFVKFDQRCETLVYADFFLISIIQTSYFLSLKESSLDGILRY